MPSGAKEDILQAAYDWIVDVIAPPDPDNQILLPSRDDDPAHLPAPAPPFVVISLLAFGQRLASLEKIVERIDDFTVNETTQQAKSGTLSLTFVGEAAEDWAHILSMTYDRFNPQVASIADVLSLTDTSLETEDGQIQRQHTLDLLIEYNFAFEAVRNLARAETVAIETNAGTGEQITGVLDDQP